MDLILYTENTKRNLSRSFCTSVCEARVPVSGSFIFSELDIVLPRTRQAFMCLRVRYVFVSRAFLWICCAPRLLTESTAHWSPIKPSSAAGTACKGFALRLPVITHQEIMALCSVSLSRSLRSYYTICKTLHQWGTYLNTEPQIIFGISNTEAQSRHRAAVGLSAESAAVYSSAQIMPDAGAIWEAKFIICFF